MSEELDALAELRRGVEQFMSSTTSRAGRATAPAPDQDEEDLGSPPPSTKRPRSRPAPVISRVDEDALGQAATVDVEDSAPEPDGSGLRLARQPVYAHAYEHHYVWKLSGTKLVLGCAHEGCESRRGLGGEYEFDPVAGGLSLQRLEEMCWDTQSNHQTMCASSIWSACPGGSGGYREPSQGWDD